MNGEIGEIQLSAPQFCKGAEKCGDPGNGKGSFIQRLDSGTNNSTSEGLDTGSSQIPGRGTFKYSVIPGCLAAAASLHFVNGTPLVKSITWACSATVCTLFCYSVMCMNERLTNSGIELTDSNDNTSMTIVTELNDNHEITGVTVNPTGDIAVDEP